MTACLHNNKVTSASKANSKRTACSRLPSSRNIHRLPLLNLNRCRRATIFKLSKYYSAPYSAPMSDNIPTTTMPSTPAKESVRISLPASLPRPIRNEIDVEALRKACPELEETPAQYTRNVILKLSTHMYAGILSAKPIASTSSLPDELQVVLTDSFVIHGVCPTHVLAITSSLGVKPGSPRKYTLFPTHQLVLAANCSGLPAFPLSPTAKSVVKTSDSVTLPVVRLSIPYPEHFGTLMWFLYKKDTTVLRQLLFTENWANDTASILRTAHVVYGVWANACALQVVEPEVFIVLEESWTEIISRLTAATSTSSASAPSASAPA